MSVLETRGVSVGYNKVDVVHDLHLEVSPGELLTVIGANGAGKSTLLRTISGVLRPSAGQIVYDGHDVTGMESARVAQLGIAHVPENRRVFPRHSVEVNLQLGGWVLRKEKETFAGRLESVLELFPILAERRRQAAGSLSGGQQQMLAMGMALMARPKLLLLDEPSLGLAPIMVREIFEAIVKLKADGVTILLVEQMASEALKIADRAVALQLGRVVFTGSAAELRASPDLIASYLGQLRRRIGRTAIKTHLTPAAEESVVIPED